MKSTSFSLTAYFSQTSYGDARQARIFIIFGICMAFMLGAHLPAGAAIFTVTTTADSGAGSLRQAVLDANVDAVEDLIAFQIPEGECSAAGVCAITLDSTIEIDEAVVIDGTTQPRFGTAPANTCATDTTASYLRIELRGNYNERMLQVISTGPVTIRGLAMGGGWGVALGGGGDYRVECNHFGITGPGDAALLTDSWGVVIENSANGVVVGTNGDGINDVGERNVFGNNDYGVYINGNSKNWIAGNYFGFGSDGVTSFANSADIYMRQGSRNNLVGTNEDGISDDLERNILGNSDIGVTISPSPTFFLRNLVVGNWIGLNAIGNPAPMGKGVNIYSTDTSQTLRGNRIEGNTTGIEIDDTAFLTNTSMCNAITGNSTGVQHYGEAALRLENNWWGSADGPSGIGPGLGDSIILGGSGSADFFPWLTSADSPCPYIFDGDFEFGDLDRWSFVSP